MFWTLSNTFEEMDTLRREMEELFNRSQRVFTASGRNFPLINIYNHPEEVRVVAELPGVQKEDLDISYTKGVLKLSGQRKATELSENTVQIRSERKTGNFEKTVKIPFEIDADKIHAELKNGVLQIGLPKAETVRTRQIEIQA